MPSSVYNQIMRLHRMPEEAGQAGCTADGGTANSSLVCLPFGRRAGREIAKFFKTGKPPVSPEETVEIMTFMEAADQSKEKGGASVSLADVLAKAKSEAAVKLKK